MDIDAVERLYAEHARGLYRFLVLRTGDPSLAEDLLADAFERVLRARRRFDPRRGRETTWLYAIAVNALRDHARRTSAESRAVERLPGERRADLAPGEEGLDLGERDELRAALGRLPEDERDALALRYGADLTVPQVARALGVPLATAEARVYGGLRRLREELS